VTFQIGNAAAPGYVDKRRGARVDDFETRIVTGPTVFTANAGGTTTTIVGANAAPGTNTNVARIGDEFKLYNSSNALKQEVVFRATAVAVAGSTTVTFTPAAAANTASGDYYRLVGYDNHQSTGNNDRRLLALVFSQAHINKLTENDKDYQLRTSDDPDSIR
jgi:hypothetical protein